MTKGKTNSKKRDLAAKVNIKDVAKAAGVSTATITRAFQAPERIAPETLRHVRSKIEELGYVPNVRARSFRTARTNIIIALVPDISHSFFSQIIRGIEKVAYENGYSVLLGDTQNDVNRERTYAQMIASKQADGLITMIPRLPDVALSGRLPVVNASSYVEDSRITRVHIDNADAARQATNLLIALGHTTIGLISGNYQSPVWADRERGYREALAAAGVSVMPNWIASGDLSVESGMSATEALLDQVPGMTAIFCENDEMALGVMKAIKLSGKKIPDDFSVIGFDDTPLAKYYEPPLTTVSQPSAAIGEESMRLLIEILTDPETPPRRRILQTQLIVRGSTGRAPTPRRTSPEASGD